MLRPYQQECIEAITENALRGVTKQLVVIPTGTGKAVIAAHLPSALNLRRGEQTLFLVHRDELIFQAVDKFEHYNPHLSVDIEKAEYRADPDADVIVASVQSIGRKGSPRLAKFDPSGFALVQVDEAHHCTNKSQYETVLTHFGVMKGESPENGKLLVGWTATPGRSDNIGLEAFFDKIAYQRNIREFIEDDWLADVIGYRIWTEHEIGHVSTRQGDFAIGELEDAINTPERNLLIVQKYREYGQNAPALAFTVDIKHSHDLADAFNQEGIPAEALSGETPTKERRHMIEEFRAGRLKVLASCGVLNEGFDAPIATVGLMGRPTKSTLLYIQQIGRILRPFPAPESRSGHEGYVKDKAVVLDFVDNCGKHSLINLSTLFGLRASFNLKGKSATETAEEVERLESQNPGLDLKSCEDIEEIRATVERIDLFSAPVIPEEVRAYSKFSWLTASDGTYHLSLPDRTMLYVRENHLGQFEIWKSISGIRSFISAYKTLDMAFHEGDQLVPKDYIGTVLTNARWRHDQPTEAQCNALYKMDRRMKQSFSSPGDLYQFAVKRHKAGDLRYTKGGISQQISALIEARKR